MLPPNNNNDNNIQLSALIRVDIYIQNRPAKNISASFVQILSVFGLWYFPWRSLW